MTRRAPFGWAPRCPVLRDGKQCTEARTPEHVHRFDGDDVPATVPREHADLETPGEGASERGRPVTTRRGRKAGGRTLSVVVNEDEHRRAEAERVRRGFSSIGAWVRALIPPTT